MTTHISPDSFPSPSSYEQPSLDELRPRGSLSELAARHVGLLEVETRPQTLPGFTFCDSSDSWIPVPPVSPASFDSSLLDSSEPPTGRRLRVITYNTWFNGMFYVERLEQIFSILQRSEADVICLQEATPELIVRLSRQRWVQQDYVMSDAHGDSILPRRFGQLILARRARGPWRFTSLPLPSTMQRRLLLGEARSVAVIALHLDSLPDSGHIRKQQLEAIEKVVRSRLQHRAVVCAGDFNFGDLAEEENALLRQGQYLDCWTSMGYAPDQGHTMRPSASFPCGWRPDRILLRGCLAVREIHLVGDEPFQVDPKLQKTLKRARSLPQHPSDHLGLCALLEWHPSCDEL